MIIFADSSLEGKKLLLDDDVNEDLLLDDGLIKKLSEEKAVSARGAYGRMKKTFVSKVLPIMAGNHYPSTNDISPGMQRRTYVIPFERKFDMSEQNADLFAKIWKTQRAGVLNRFIEGYLRFLKRGCKFQEPQDCLAAKKRFFVESNPLRAFLDDKCFKDADAKIPLSDFRAAFKDWAKENDFPVSSLAGNKLRGRMELLDFEVVKIKGYPYIRGIVLK
jgi:P4 family phage/plasmid primase-like protien